MKSGPTANPRNLWAPEAAGAGRQGVGWEGGVVRVKFYFHKYKCCDHTFRLSLLCLGASLTVGGSLMFFFAIRLFSATPPPLQRRGC